MPLNKSVFLLPILLSALSAMGQSPAPAAKPTTEPDKVVVRVNGDPIYAGEVQMAAQQLAQNMAHSGRKIDPQRIGSASMQQMVDSVLLTQEAERRKYTADPKAVAKGIAKVEKDAGGAEQLNVALKQQGLTRARFEKVIRDSEITKQLLQKLSEGIKISDEKVAGFYKDNPDYFKAPEEVSARHILIKVAKDASPEVDKAAKDKAAAARKRALAGEDFATLATEVSEGPSAAKGGQLGFFSRERMVKPFADAAFALKPGGISDVVRTQFGYHVIKVEDHKDPRVVPLEEVGDRIRQGLTRDEQGQRVKALLTELREKAKIETVGPDETDAR